MNFRATLSLMWARVRVPMLPVLLMLLMLPMLLSLLPMHVAHAQYDYNPTAPDELNEPGIRYFGSVKDERGALVSGALIELNSDRFNLMFLTDDLGRFKGNVPRDTVLEKVAARCSKPGYSVVRITRRPGPANVKPTVQIVCVLRAVATK